LKETEQPIIAEELEELGALAKLMLRCGIARIHCANINGVLGEFVTLIQSCSTSGDDLHT
jgi:hypothetical protein